MALIGGSMLVFLYWVRAEGVCTLLPATPSTLYRYKGHGLGLLAAPTWMQLC